MTDKIIPHGAYVTYVNYGCRCDDCKAANAEYMKQARAKRVARGVPVGDPRHGKYSTYVNHGCRCGECKQANAAYRKITIARNHAKLVAQDAAMRSGFSY